MFGWRCSKCVFIAGLVHGRSLTLLQEVPFKLDVIGKDFYDASIVSVDFLAAEGSMTFAASDDRGDLRLLEFDMQRRSCGVQHDTLADSL